MFGLILLLLAASCNQKNLHFKDLPAEINKFSGVKYAFIEAVESQNTKFYLLVDTIQYFAGKHAQEAYFQDNNKDLDETTFYIRNTIVDSVRFLISDTTNIVTKTFEYSNITNIGVKATLQIEKFGKILKDPKLSYIKKIPFRINIKDDVVILIEEIYLP